MPGYRPIMGTESLVSNLDGAACCCLAALADATLIVGGGRLGGHLGPSFFVDSARGEMLTGEV